MEKPSVQLSRLAYRGSAPCSRAGRPPEARLKVDGSQGGPGDPNQLSRNLHAIDWEKSHSSQCVFALPVRCT